MLSIYPWMDPQTLACSISDDDFRPGGSGTGQESLQCLVRTVEGLPVQTQSPASTQDCQQLFPYTQVSDPFGTDLTRKTAPQGT